MFGFTFQYDATMMMRYQVNADGEGKIAPLPIRSFIQYVRDAVRLYGDAAYDGNTIIVTYRSYGEEQYNSNVKNGITVFGSTFQVTPMRPWDERLVGHARLAWRQHMDDDLRDAAERIASQPTFLPPAKLMRCPTHVRIPDDPPAIDDYSPQAPFSPRSPPTNTTILPHPLVL